MRFLSDNVSDSIYSETVELMRDDPFFFQNQAIQARGLQPINLDNHTPGAAAPAIANLFEMTTQLQQNSAITNYYYTYGWSGLLSRSARYNDAKQFILSLEHEISAFRARGIHPKIRLLGYSHGGTIVIKLAMVKQRENLQPNFTIDEAFLFGTPIQYDTDYYINDPLFKKVYNIFSRGDRVQKLDFFSCGEFFSDRAFRNRFDYTVPDKLVQIEIRVVRKKGESCSPLALAQDCSQICNGKMCKRNFRNVSPGHTELWFLGWTPMHYRSTFPLYPLPIVTFMPFIINTIKSQQLAFKSDVPITVTVDPRRNSMVINNNLRCDHQVFELPFVGIQNLITLKQTALSYKPDLTLFNKEKYDEHICIAYDKAIFVLRDKKCKQKLATIIPYATE